MELIRTFDAKIWYSLNHLRCKEKQMNSSIEKKSALNETHQNGFVDLKKLPNELKCRKKLKFKYTEF